MLHSLPSFAIIELHPIVLSIFDFAGVLERLSEQLTQIVVVRSILKSKVPDVAKVFAELLCHCVQFNIIPSRENTETYQDSLRTDP